MQRLLQLLMIFTVVLYSSYAYLFFYQTGMSGIKPLYWEMLTVGIALSVIVLNLPTNSFKVPLYFGLWTGLFLCNSIICFLYSPQGEVEVEVLIESFKVFALLFSFVIIFQVTDSINLARIALLVVVLFAVFMNLIDFITPIWTKVAGRGAGFYINPTIAGKIIVLAMVITFPLVSKNLRLAYCAIVGLGVLVTFSRGAWLLWVVAIIGLTASGYIIIKRKVLGTVFITALTVSFLFLLITGVFLEYLNPLGLLDYMTPGTLARIGGSDSTGFDQSAVSRAAAAAKALGVIGQHPWLGLGIGHDRVWGMSIGAHNTYLRMAVEGGFVRLAIFVGLLLTIWNMTDSIGRVTLVVYAVSCLTSQDNFRQPALLLILALVSVLKQPKSSELELSAENDEQKSYT